MKIAIVDDCAADRAQLRQALARWAAAHGMPPPAPEEFDSAEAFLAAGAPFDLVFLDIYMDGMTGMEAARRLRLRDAQCRIVFITSSPDFGVESYAVNASYYLLKPFDGDQLAQAMARCGADAPQAPLTLTVPGRYGQEQLPVHRITHAEYVSRKVLVHFDGGEETQVNMGWTEFAAQLLRFPAFCDCMKGMLVNFEAVKKLTEDSFLLQSGQRLPISRLKYRDVRKQFIDWSYQKARGDRA